MIDIPIMERPEATRRALRNIVIYGGVGGLLIAALRLAEYRLLIVEHSIELYGGLVAALFAGLGIWLGLTLTKKKTEVVVHEVPVPVPVESRPPFVRNEARVRELALTPRELEMLAFIASGLSNREIAEKAFVSENTVKTHSSRLFDKLGARRRTEAVQIGRAEGLIP